MSDRITSQDVAHIARLSRLELSDDELTAATAELGAVLDYFADIDDLDLDGVAEMHQPYPLTNVMRDDVVGSTLDRDVVLSEAPAAEDGQFRVPPVGAGES